MKKLNLLATLSLSALIFTDEALAATATKQATGTDLTGNTAGVWSGGGGANGSPGSGDLATWNSSSLGAGLTLTNSVIWGGINVSGALTDITITGAGTLTNGSSGITLSINNATLDIPLVLNNAQQWNPGSETLTINSNISSSYSLLITGNVTLGNSANATFGDTTNASGTLTAGNTTTFGSLTVNGTFNPQSNPSNNCVYTMNGLFGSGTVTTVYGGGYNRILSVGNNNVSSTFSGLLYQGGNRPLTLNKIGSGTLTLSGTSANVEGGGSGSFIVNVTQGELDLGKSGVVCLPGSGLITINGGLLKLTGTGGNQISDTKPLTISSGTFDLNGNTEAIDALNGTGGVIDNTASSSTATLTVGANNSSGAFSGVIQNTGSSATLALVQGGTGTLTLSGANTYGGGTTISAGTIKIGANNALPTGTTVNFGSAATSGILDLGGYNQQVAGFGLGSGHSWGSSDIIGNSSTTASSVLTNSGTSTFGGVIKNTLGSGNKNVGLAVSAGTLTLSGANTYSGATTISGGNLTIGTTGVIGSGGSTAITLSSGGTLTNNSTVATTGGITGSSSLTVGSGTVANLNTANNYSGATSVTGTLLLADSNAVTNSAVTLNNGATLQLRNNSSTSFNSSGAVLDSGAVNASVTVDVNNNNSSAVNNTLTLANGYSATEPPSSVGAGTYTTTFNVTGGNSYTLALPTVTYTEGGTYASGSPRNFVLYFNPTSASVSLGNVSLVGSGSRIGLYLTLGGTSSSNYVTGAISSTSGTTRSMTKNGTGTWMLSGTNTYTGTTTVSGGTLLVDSPGSLASGSAVTVAAGATLGGNGTINGTVNVSAGGILAAGSNLVGTLTFTNNLTLSATSTNLFVVTTAGGASNSVAVTGGTFTPNSTVIEINTAGDANLGAGTYALFNYTGSTLANSFNATPAFVPPQTGLAANAYITNNTGNSTIALVVPRIPTTNTVTTTAGTVPYSTTVVFTSTVQTNAPLGTATGANSNVVFSVDGTPMATNGLVNGVAYYTNNTLTVAGSPHTIQAAYLGDGTYLPSTNTVSQTITPFQPVQKTAPSASAITYGQALSNSIVTGAVFTNAAGGTVAMASTNFVTPGIVPNAPSTNVSVYYMPADATDYLNVTNLVTVLVNQASNNLALAAVPSATVGYQDSVSYTATVQFNGGTAADATGPVIFSYSTYGTNGAVAFSTNNCVGGVASSVTISNQLPRGTNLITAAYASYGNYLGWTNTLNQVVTNHPPAANLMTVTRPAGLGLTIALSSIATNWSDADGDPVELTSVTLLSTNGVSLYAGNWVTNLDGSIATTNNGFIGYTNPANVNDQISYSIGDGQGGTNVGFIDIIVTNSVTGTNNITAYNFSSPFSNTVTAYGVINFNYILERATNLSPAVWVDIQTNQAATNGIINAADTFWDLGGVKPHASYYRFKWEQP